MSRIKLTVKIVDEATADAGRDELLWDEQLVGFGLRVSRGGIKSWVVQYTAPDGRRRRLTFGRVGPVTLAQARKLAAEKLRDVATGMDPAEEKQRLRQAPTLGDLRDRFIAEHGARRARTTRHMYKSGFRELVAVLGEGRLVESLRWEDISKVHTGLEDRPYLANRTLATIRAALNTAKKWGWYPRELANPGEGHEPFPEERRGQVLTRQQVTAVGEALAEEPEGSLQADCLRLLMLTGARPMELAHARWKDVTGDGRLVHLEQSKTGPRYVYLGRPAAELLEALPRDREWIFPGAVEGKPIYDLASVWNRVRERADLPPGVRLYDVTRHGFITRAAGLGVPLEERKLLSGHAPSREAHFKYLHQTASDGSLTDFGRHLVAQADKVAEAIFGDLVASVAPVDEDALSPSEASGSGLAPIEA